MNTGHSPFILLALTGLLALQGCGDANDSTKGGGGGGKVPPPESSATPTVEVLIQGTPAMADPELGTVAVKNIRVISVDHDGQSFGNYFQASDYSYKIQNGGSYRITFNESFPYRVDLIIAVELEGGEVLRRMLPNSRLNRDGQPHPINPATEYAMAAFFEQVNEAQFEEMLPCPQGTLVCDHQWQVAAPNLGGLMEAVADYEIELAPSMNLDQALQSMAENVAFRRFVDQSIDSLKQKKIVGVGFDLENPDAAIDGYNTVAFSLGLNQGNPRDVTLGSVTAPEGSSQTAIFSNWISSETSIPSGSGGSLPYYPSASLAAWGVAYVSQLFVGDTPQLRSSLTLQAGAPAQVQPITTASEHNILGIGGAPTFLTTQGFYEFSTLQSQSVTGLNKDPQLNDPIGWLTNPYFASLYDAKSQSALLDARAFSGYVLDVSGSQRPFIREAILERTHTFQFITYSLQSDQPHKQGQPQFHGGIINKKQYGVIGLTQKFNETEPTISVSSGLYHWAPNDDGTSFFESQPSTALFNNQTLSRDGNGAPYAVTAPIATPRDRDFQVLTNKSGGKDYFTGRLSLETSGSEQWIGMSGPQGKLLTFNLDTEAEGQGIVHAVELTAAAPTSLAGERYRLKGNGFGMTTTENFLFHVDDSELIFNEDGSATLVMNQVRVAQDVNSLEVSTFTEKDIGTCTTTSVVRDSTYTNAISLDFPASTECPEFGVTLEGFVAEPDATNSDEGGRLMILRLRQGNSIGLLYGMRQKNLTPAMHAN